MSSQFLARFNLLTRKFGTFVFILVSFELSHRFLQYLVVVCQHSTNFPTVNMKSAGIETHKVKTNLETYCPSASYEIT